MHIFFSAAIVFKCPLAVFFCLLLLYLSLGVSLYTHFAVCIFKCLLWRHCCLLFVFCCCCSVSFVLCSQLLQSLPHSFRVSTHKLCVHPNTQ